MDPAIVLFPSSNFAIFAKKAIERQGLYAKLLPVPRALSSNCGVCIRIHSKDSDPVLSILQGKSIPFEAMVDGAGASLEIR